MKFSICLNNYHIYVIFSIFTCHKMPINFCFFFHSIDFLISKNTLLYFEEYCVHYCKLLFKKNHKNKTFWSITEALSVSNLWNSLAWWWCLLLASNQTIEDSCWLTSDVIFVFSYLDLSFKGTIYDNFSLYNFNLSPYPNWIFLSFFNLNFSLCNSLSYHAKNISTICMIFSLSFYICFDY